jgi:four helix bundle protein
MGGLRGELLVVEKRGMLNVECLMLNVDIQERAFAFACRIVRLTEHIHRCRSLSARVISRQLLNAGTSVGANLEEASSAQSKPDFISKCSIAAKEARESRYWLRLLGTCKLVDSKRLSPLIIEAGEIVAIVTTIVKNAAKTKNRGTIPAPPVNIQH